MLCPSSQQSPFQFSLDTRIYKRSITSELHLSHTAPALRLSNTLPVFFIHSNFPSVIPGLYSISNTQPPMLYYVEPQPCNSRQEPQEIKTDPSGDYGFVSSPQISYNRGHLGHLPVVFPGYHLVAYERPQNLACNSDGSNFAGAGFGIEYRSPSTLPPYLEEDLGWQQEADAPFYNLPEKQVWDQVGQSLCPQISHSDESDIASSEQSSPSILEGYCLSAAGSLPQNPQEASYGNQGLELYQPTLGSFLDRNWGTQQSSR